MTNPDTKWFRTEIKAKKNSMGRSKNGADTTELLLTNYDPQEGGSE